MITSIKSIPKAVDLWFTENMLNIRLEDGSEIGVPLEWFPKLIKASSDQRNNWRLVGSGIGIHWEDIDEDLSVQKLIQ